MHYLIKIISIALKLSALLTSHSTIEPLALSQNQRNIKVSNIIYPDSVKTLTIYVPNTNFLEPFTEPHQKDGNMKENVYRLLLGQKMNISSLPHLKIYDPDQIHNIISDLDSYIYSNPSIYETPIFNCQISALPYPDWLYIYKHYSELSALIIVSFMSNIDPIVISEVGDVLSVGGYDFVNINPNTDSGTYSKIKSQLFKQGVSDVYYAIYD